MTTSITADGLQRRPARVPFQGAHYRQARFQPMAGATGRTGYPSVHRHGLWLFGVLVAAVQSAGHHRASGLCARHELHRSSVFFAMRLADFDARLDLHPVLHLPGLLGRHLGWLAGACRPTQGGCGLGAVLVRRSADFCAGGLYPPDLADVDRLRGHWRYRPGPGLHLAGVDPDQVVPGQARHGHRHGDHGFRRWCDGRCARWRRR